MTNKTHLKNKSPNLSKFITLPLAKTITLHIYTHNVKLTKKIPIPMETESFLLHYLTLMSTHKTIDLDSSKQKIRIRTINIKLLAGLKSGWIINCQLISFINRRKITLGIWIISISKKVDSVKITI